MNIKARRNFQERTRPAITGAFYCHVIQISYKRMVTPAQAGVQFKDAWIPAARE